MTRPNIVVIQADQMAAASLGAYGDAAARTPWIDSLAEEGAVFERALCTTPLCSPSRASMMTGVLPSELGCFDNGDDFGASVPTFAHRLRAAGYHTALVGRMHFIGPDQHHGFEERLTTDVYPADLDMVPDWGRPLEQRLQWYHNAEPVAEAGVSLASVQQDFDDEVLFRSLRHLADRARANRAAEEPQPFLMVSSFIHPHDPYEPPREHWDRFADVAIPPPAHPEPATDPHSERLRVMCGFDRTPPTAAEVATARRAYYAAVSYIDDHVGRILSRLEELGLAEDTVVVVTSDHGDMLGERGLWYTMSPFERSARVPLIVRGPERWVRPGRYTRPVSLLDLMPTLCELAGTPVEEDPVAVASGRLGRSLLATARRETAGEGDDTEQDVRIEYLAEGTHHPQLTLVRGRHKLVVCPGDPDLLFDVEADPHELTDLAEDPGHAGLRESMRADLAARYDLAALEREVLASQERRTLVAGALSRGRRRAWDLVPDAEQRYVRGDFWNALGYGRIPG